MATLQEIYNLYYEGKELRSRVVAAIADASIDVLNEDVGTANHTNRLVWASDALLNSEAMTAKMYWGVLGNTTIQNNGNASTDNDIKFVVNSLIDTYANATI